MTSVEQMAISNALARGVSYILLLGLSSRPRPKEEKHIQEAANLVAQMATEKGVSPEAILIAWILRHPARIQPLPGTTNPERIRAAAEAGQVSLMVYSL